MVDDARWEAIAAQMRRRFPDLYSEDFSGPDARKLSEDPPPLSMVGVLRRENVHDALTCLPMAVAELVANYRPGSADGRAWSWDDERRDILARECLCCGARGHYQRQLEEHIAEHGIPGGVCLGPDGRVWDGHHRIVAAIHLGISHIALETPQENAERWCQDHGSVSWDERKFGDRHGCSQ